MRRLLAILFLAQTVLSAHYWLAGEALLLRPALYRPYTAIKSPNFTIGGTPLAGRWVGNTKPGFDWGYRVEVGYGWCCNDIRVNWTSWIHTDPFFLSADSNQNIWLTFIHPTTATAINFVSPGALRRRDQYKFQALDGEFSHWRCSAIRLFAGIRYVRIRYNTAIDVTGTNILVTDLWESDVQGVGPRIGIEGRAELCWSLSLFGNANVALLLGSAKGRYLDSQLNAGTPTLTADRMSPANLVIANPEIRFGLGYCRKVCCVELDAAAGYQLSYLSRGTLRAQFYSAVAQGASMVTRDPFALDGWLFRLTGRY